MSIIISETCCLWIALETSAAAAGAWTIELLISGVGTFAPGLPLQQLVQRGLVHRTFHHQALLRCSRNLAGPHRRLIARAQGPSKERVCQDDARIWDGKGCVRNRRRLMAACDHLSHPACAALDPQQPQIILLKEGTDTSQGKPQLVSNINACMAVADTVRTTLGPRGMDKLIHNDKARSRGEVLTAAARRSSQSTHGLTTVLTSQMRAPRCFQTHILLHTSGSGIRGRGLCRAMQVPRPEACMLGLSAQGQVTISNDGATIMKLLEIVHPAAKSLVDVSLAQDAEVRMHACMRDTGLHEVACWVLASWRTGSDTQVGASNSQLPPRGFRNVLRARGPLSANGNGMVFCSRCVLTHLSAGPAGAAP